MLQIQVDEEAIEQLYKDAIQERLDELDKEMVYWDTKELKRRTNMSWNTILNTFFHEDGFPKVKVGGKWYFPADDAKLFLNEWLKKRRRVKCNN